MKKIFTALAVLISYLCSAQSTIYLRGDTIRAEKSGGNSELVLLNGSRTITGGVLTNLGNGRTAFVLQSSSGGLSGGNLGSAYRWYVPGSQGIKSLLARWGLDADSATANSLGLIVDSAEVQPKLTISGSLLKNNNILTFQNDGDYTGRVYGQLAHGVRGYYRTAIIDTSNRFDDYMLLYDVTTGQHYYRPLPDSSGGAGTPGGSDTYVQFNRNGAFAGVDSLKWDGNGLDNKYRYRINGVTVAWLPNQTNFTGSLFLGNGGASLSHTSGIQGFYNHFSGVGSGLALSSGSQNSGNGSRIMPSATTATQNAANGDAALFTCVTCSRNVANGVSALQNAGNAVANETATGWETLFNVTGNNNSSHGGQGFRELLAGTDNTGNGFQHGYFNRAGIRNVISGSQAGLGVSTLSDYNRCVLLGYGTGIALLTNGDDNFFGGYRAGDNATTASRSIVLGSDVDVPSATAAGQVNIANLYYGTGATGTGTTHAGSAGIGISDPREKLDVNGVVSIRTVNAGTSVDSILTMEDGRVKSVASTAIATGANVSSGTYTPTLTNATNITSSTAYQCQYIRVGDVITVSGKVDITPTTDANTNTLLQMTLPPGLESSFVDDGNLAGTGGNPAYNTVVTLNAGVAAGKVDLHFLAPIDSSTFTVWFHFTYRIVAI